ncbi:MAG: hybrid sensor histidine kinase/response regulator, partial [Planctomycetes bacterium]|nr:hybrid sensor histidine kinase/response regulator [Planctomycetota bacterium]
MDKNSYNILIVDDEEIICETLKMLLHRQEYNVISRNSASEAFDYLESENPDLILLDVMMPNMDGFSACKRIKLNVKWKHIPIILITALEGKENLIRGLESGADEFLSKPVNGPELRARVRSMLRIKQQYDELEENMKMRDYLSHMIMHDIRNPLLSIALMCELSMNIIKNDENKDRKYYSEFENIQNEAKQLNSFINDMLLVTKLESGKLVLNRKTVDVINLIEKTILNHEMIANQRKIEISVEINKVIKNEYEFDENLIMRVLDNLLSNAIKFSSDNGEIKIKLDECGS